MLKFAPSSHYELLRQYEQEYDDGVAAGNILPFVYPIGSYAAALVVVFLLLPPSASRLHKYGRYTTFAIVLGASAYTIRYCRSRTVALGFGIGLMCAWCIIWSATLLIFNDAKRDFRRLERTPSNSDTNSSIDLIKPANGIVDVNTGNSSTGLRERWHVHESSIKETVQEDPKCLQQRRGEFKWQSYPRAHFMERLDWVLDLFCNFRGVGWNWQISCLPSYPPWVQAQLEGKPEDEYSLKDEPVSYTGIKRFQSKEEVLRHNIYLLVEGYLLIDLLKTIMNHDPYFWGEADSLPPSYFPSVLRSYPVLLRGYRLTVVMMMVKAVLRSVFSMSAPFFVGILGTEFIGARGEPWYYPDSWGSYSTVLDSGLGGWWGSWWHQTFRYAFLAGGNWTTSQLGVEKKSLLGKAVKLFVAFSLSGFLHACGSITQTGETRPWSGPFMFFVLQPVGILTQRYLAKVLSVLGITQRMPRWVRRGSNIIFIHTWFYYTGPLVCDDWAKGGIFLFEPIAFSPLRGLGFGVEGDEFWCWKGQWAHLHEGRSWWSSGIAP